MYCIIFGGIGGIIRPTFIDNIRNNTKSQQFIGGAFIGVVTVMMILGIGNGDIDTSRQFLPLLLIGISALAGFWASNLVNFYQTLLPILQEAVQEKIINYLKKGKNDK